MTGAEEEDVRFLEAFDGDAETDIFEDATAIEEDSVDDDECEVVGGEGARVAADDDEGVEEEIPVVGLLFTAAAASISNCNASDMNCATSTCKLPIENMWNAEGRRVLQEN
jgi:hypothetical protein